MRLALAEYQWYQSMFLAEQPSLFWMTLRLPNGGNTIFSCHLSSFFQSSNAMFSFLLHWHAKQSSFHSLAANTFRNSVFSCNPKLSSNILDCLNSSMSRMTSRAEAVGLIKMNAMPVASQRCLSTTGSVEWRQEVQKQLRKVPQRTARTSCCEGRSSRKASEEKTVRWQGNTSSCGCMLQTMMKQVPGLSWAQRQLLLLFSLKLLATRLQANGGLRESRWARMRLLQHFLCLKLDLNMTELVLSTENWQTVRLWDCYGLRWQFLWQREVLLRMISSLAMPLRSARPMQFSLASQPNRIPLLATKSSSMSQVLLSLECFPIQLTPSSSRNYTKGCSFFWMS